MCVLESRTFAEMGSLFHKVGEKQKKVPFQILVPCLLFKTNTNFRGKNQKKFTFETINGDFFKFQPTKFQYTYIQQNKTRKIY